MKKWIRWLLIVGIILVLIIMIYPKVSGVDDALCLSKLGIDCGTNYDCKCLGYKTKYNRCGSPFLSSCFPQSEILSKSYCFGIPYSCK